MTIIYIVGAVVLGLVVSWFIFLFITALCEKQYLSGDIEPVSEPFPYKPSPYWLATGEHARMAGLIRVGNFATKRNTSIVKGLASAWVTPDRTTIMNVVGGSFAGMPLKKTVLRSRLADGRVLESTDNPYVGDPTGLIEMAVLLNAGVPELLEFHRQRLLQSTSPAVPFARPDVQMEWEQIDLERGARLVQMGFARWVDPQHTMTRATVRGALRFLFHGQGKQMRQLHDQQGRTSVKRAGT